MSNVLFLHDIVLKDPKSGTPQHLCEMLRQIRKEHTLTVCATSVPDDLADIFVPYPSLKRGFAKLRALRTIVQEKKITHIFTASMVGLLAPVLLKFWCGVKVADEIHGLDYEQFYRNKQMGYLRYLYMKCKVWLLLCFYDTVFVMSIRLRDRYWPISRNWVLVLYGGVDVDAIPDSSDRVQKHDTLTVGYMGNARAYQGLPNLVEAADVARKDGLPVRLNLIINGDCSEIIEDLKTRGLYEITTLSISVPHSEAIRLISRSDILVIPRARDVMMDVAFPGKFAEYLATGIPSIVTRGGPIDEKKEEFDRISILVDADNAHDIPRNIADALERFHAMDTDLRRVLGKKARAFALAHLTWEARGKIFNEQFR